MAIEVDLRQVVYALSDAVDLVGVDDFYHGKRVAMMAAEFGRAYGLPESEIDLAFDAALVHDCGVSSSRVHSRLAAELDWSDAQQHCDIGFELLQGFRPLAHLSKIVLYHHTHWDALASLGVEPRTALISNLILLADRIDALAIPHYRDQSLMKFREQIRSTIGSHRGGMFSPALVDSFLAISVNEAFWFSLEQRYVTHYLAQMAARRNMRPLEFVEIKQFALMFSRIVDAKSAFTAEHSLKVAKLARLLAQLSGVSQDGCDMIEVAGLLHDIGKLRVPDEILEKKGPLDQDERAAMVRHSFETFEILRSISGLETISEWAAYHHERPDGSGYPYHVKGGQLPFEARIVAVSDVFQALAQDRPYRRALSAPDILSHLAGLAAAGRIDKSLVQLVEQNLDACWLAATS